MRVVAFLPLLALACGQPARPGSAAAPVALPTPRHRPAPPPPEPMPTTTLSVKVVDERGRPVARAEVRAVVEGQRAACCVSYFATQPDETDAAGVAVLSFPVYASALVVMASHADWPMQTVAVERRVSPTIVLGPPRAIRGHVELKGCPNSALSIEVSSLIPETALPFEVYHREVAALPAAPVAADGSFTLLGLGPGRYRAGVRACGRSAATRFTAHDARIELTLPDRPADEPFQAPVPVTTKPAPAVAP